MDRLLENIDTEAKYKDKVHDVTAMRSIKKCLEDLTSESIANCWLHTDLIVSEHKIDLVQEESVLVQEFEPQIEELIPVRRCISIPDLFHADGKDERAELGEIQILVI